ncbi:hypothetical protein MNB_SV-13-2099 [hydrothermal vent metagenome]|uniref:FlgD/Vpr Ig-like domain-containing protein n=1 Tax=hydrothermal vent metagenome TaxID=652676 RepID=A0A1W1CEI8_9ZZZZ
MKKIIALVLLGSYLFAGEIIEMIPYKNSEFSPSLNEKFSIKFELKKDTEVEIDIYTPDNNLIRSLHSKVLKKGKNSIEWDGKDSNGTIVPNEAYNIVVKADKEILDFRKTGGEIVKDLQSHVDKQGHISYRLSKPSRVLVRVGVENSSMLRVISNWIPKNRGKVLQRWSMRDKDNIVDISKLKYAVSVSAFTLCDYSIITNNNKKENYISYFQRNKLKCNTIPNEKQILKRGDRGISKHFYGCRIQERDPRLELKIPKAKTDKQDIPILSNGKRTLIKVTMNPEDEAILEKVKYEVSFFVDFEFSSEEELGYMPISWNFNPNGLKKGKHILTVNVSSFSGQVGVKSLEFLVE